MRAMKRLFIVFASSTTLLVLFSCHTNNSNDTNTAPANPNGVSPDVINITASASGKSNDKLPKMVFVDTNYDFGTITEGAKVTHTFQYKNMGTADLVIAGATASCGCTKPSYSQNVKHPGDTGTISVTFDSSNKTGKMLKTVTISSNCQPPVNYITINVNIQPSNK
jgi:hypothetical protein